MSTPPRKRCLYTAFASAFVFSLVFLSGCGGKTSKVLTLSGKVTYKDQPLGGGKLTLQPADSNTQPVTTQIGADGTYLITPPGTGEMKVAIETESIRGSTGTAYKNPIPGVKVPEVDTSKLPKYVRIPPKYAKVQTSNLSVTIEKGKNVKDFVLTD